MGVGDLGGPRLALDIGVDAGECAGVVGAVDGGAVARSRVGAGTGSFFLGFAVMMIGF